MSYFFSSGSFQSNDLAEIISLGVERGFNVELSSEIDYSSDIRETLTQAKKQILLLVHNYFPPPAEPFVLNLASTDSQVHQRSVTLCRKAIDLCSDLELPFYSVHAGFAFHLVPDDLGNPVAQRLLRDELLIPREQAYQKFLETISNLACYARAKNVGLLVENNVAARENLEDDGKCRLLLSQVDEITRFFKDLKDPWVRLLLDVGHAKVSAQTFGEEPERYFECLTPYIEALHLSDNDGLRDTNQPIREESWFYPFLKEFTSKTWVVEVSRLSLSEMLAQRRLLEKQNI